MSNEIKMCNNNLVAPQLETFFDVFSLQNELKRDSHLSNDTLGTQTILNNQNDRIEVNINLIKNNLSTLKHINICCGLTKVPNVIFNFKYLIELNLSNNSLEILPEEIGNLCNLKTLNLSFNKLNSLPKSVGHIQQLSSLDVSHNKFCNVPDVFYYGLSSLKMLDLSSNQITVFDDIPRCLNTLIALGLSNNSFKQLPLWFFDALCQLQFLCIDDNQLCLDIKIVNYCTYGIFDSLKFINIENCGLSHKNLEILSYFKNLNVIHVGNKKISCKQKKRNYLGDFKMEMFKGSSKTRCLYMQNAQIPSLPSDFDCLKNIEILDLSDNLLTWLPESFCNLFTLKILNLSSNELLFLPKNFGNLISLKEIHLGNNKLYNIPESFYNLSNLEFIDLYGNRLDKIQMNIVQNKNLKGIDLGMNVLHFEICDCCDSDDEIKKAYIFLKESFRKHFKCMENRCDLQEAKSVIESNSDSYSNGGSVESESLSEAEDTHLINVPQGGGCLDESWEERDLNKFEEDELFDPNEFIKLEKPNNICNFEYRNNYCPAKQHMPSILKSYSSTSNNETVEDGQFDSD